MNETKKLYDEDPYLRMFDATALRVDGNEVVLDRTAFYPEGGGQVGDIGFIGGDRVVDTQIMDGSIVHVLGEPPGFGVGNVVQGEIDWERRHRIMKLHSAAHIMEHFLHRELGEITRQGSRVDDEKDRADYAYDGRLPADALSRVEEAANRFIAEDHEIVIRLDPRRPGIRIWSCEGIEMLCGGTHVRGTGEIGTIKLRRRNPGRGVERVETALANG